MEPERKLEREGEEKRPARPRSAPSPTTPRSPAPPMPNRPTPSITVHSLPVAAPERVERERERERERFGASETPSRAAGGIKLHLINARPDHSIDMNVCLLELFSKDQYLRYWSWFTGRKGWLLPLSRCLFLLGALGNMSLLLLARESGHMAIELVTSLMQAPYLSHLTATANPNMVRVLFRSSFLFWFLFGLNILLTALYILLLRDGRFFILIVTALANSLSLFVDAIHYSFRTEAKWLCFCQALCFSFIGTVFYFKLVPTLKESLFLGRGENRYSLDCVAGDLSFALSLFLFNAFSRLFHDTQGFITGVFLRNRVRLQVKYHSSSRLTMGESSSSMLSEVSCRSEGAERDKEREKIKVRNCGALPESSEDEAEEGLVTLYSESSRPAANARLGGAAGPMKPRHAHSHNRLSASSLSGAEIMGGGGGGEKEVAKTPRRYSMNGPRLSISSGEDGFMPAGKSERRPSPTSFSPSDAHNESRRSSERGKRHTLVVTQLPEQKKGERRATEMAGRIPSFSSSASGHPVAISLPPPLVLQHVRSETRIQGLKPSAAALSHSALPIPSSPPLAPGLSSPTVGLTGAGSKIILPPLLPRVGSKVTLVPTVYRSRITLNQKESLLFLCCSDEFVKEAFSYFQAQYQGIMLAVGLSLSASALLLVLGPLAFPHKHSLSDKTALPSLLGCASLLFPFFINQSTFLIMKVMRHFEALFLSLQVTGLALSWGYMLSFDERGWFLIALWTLSHFCLFIDSVFPVVHAETELQKLILKCLLAFVIGYEACLLVWLHLGRLMRDTPGRDLEERGEQGTRVHLFASLSLDICASFVTRLLLLLVLQLRMFVNLLRHPQELVLVQSDVSYSVPEDGGPTKQKISNRSSTASKITPEA